MNVFLFLTNINSEIYFKKSGLVQYLKFNDLTYCCPRDLRPCIIMFELLGASCERVFMLSIATFTSATNLNHYNYFQGCHCSYPKPSRPHYFPVRPTQLPPRPSHLPSRPSMLPTSFFRGPTSFLRGPPICLRGPTSFLRGPPISLRGPPSRVTEKSIGPSYAFFPAL